MAEDNALPLVSIIMPTHNAGRFIGQAVQSVLDQTYPHWELLIIDDASSDDTQAIVEALANSPQAAGRIRYHQSERIGHPAGVRNIGLRMAQGELIAFLDSDDMYYPQTLEKLSAPLRENPELTAVYGFSFNMDEYENPLPQSINLTPNGDGTYVLPPGTGHSWENIATSNISCLLAALMLRRSAQEQIGFFNEALCGPEDYEFYVRMYLHNYTGVRCLSDYVYQYRIHSASLTKAPQHCERLLSSCMTIMDWMFNEAPVPAEVHLYRSRAYVACYRYLARERLLHGQPALARKIAAQAFFNPNVRRKDFLRQCGPLLFRSFLPTGFDQYLVQARRLLRMRFNPSPALSSAPMELAI